MSGLVPQLPSPVPSSASTSTLTPRPTPTPTPPAPAGGSQVPGQSMRRLLPATSTSAEMNARALARNPSPSSTTPTVRSDSPPSSEGPKKRQATTAACGPCRKRKSKCDGRRPLCSTCVERGTKCKFETNAAETHTQALKRKYNELQDRQYEQEQILDILRVRPEKDAIEILKRMRQGMDTATILRHVTVGNIMLQLSLVPEARYRYEFPYMDEMPSFLTRRENPYLDSEMYGYALRTPAVPSQSQALPPTATRGSLSPSPEPDSDLEKQLAPYWKPYHAVEMIDPYLDEVRPSRWTNVSSDDGLMRKLLQAFFLYESSWLAPIHKDYFLRDMAKGWHQFCSPLLVNALLAYACYFYRDLEYRGQHWNPKFLGYQFLAEARRLFDIESAAERPHISPTDPGGPSKIKEWECHQVTIIQTCGMLTMVYNLNGSDAIGWGYTVRAIDIARKIGLFDGPRGDLDHHTQCVRDYTAWALYIYQGTHRYHCLRAPLIKDPPRSPLPDPYQYPGWYGELWVRYPFGMPRTPTHHGLLVKARADLLTICIDFASLAFRGSASPIADLPIGHIFDFYHRLIRWRENLPDPLTPKKIVLPNQLKLHMYYNLILVNILQPIARMGDDLSLSHWPFSHKSPRDAYLDAKIHFETAFRLYYLRHGFENPDPFLGQFMSALIKLTLDTINEDPGSPFIEEWRSTVLLAAKGMYEQSRSAYVLKALLQVTIGLMTPRDVDRLKHFARIEADQEIREPLEEPIHSIWRVMSVGHDPSTESLTHQVGNLSLGSPSPRSVPARPF